MGHAPDGPGSVIEVLTGGDPSAVSAWYGGGRLHALASLPGAAAPRRWRECDGGPRSVVTVDVADVAAARAALRDLPAGTPGLDTAPALQARAVLAGEVAPWTGQGGGAHEEAPVLFLVAMAVDPAAEAEYNRWYDAEHIPILLEHPGWLAARRLRCDSPVPEYVTVYRAAHPGIVSPQARAAVRRTEWSRRMLSGTFVTHTRCFLEPARP